MAHSHSLDTGRSLAGACRSFFTSAALSYRALFNWATPSLYVGSVLLPPLFQLFFFVFLGRTLNTGSDEFFVMGNLVLACSISGIFGGTMAMANERNFATLPYLIMSTQRRITTLASRGLPFVVNGMVASTFVAVCATPALGFDWSPPVVLGMAAAVVVASVSSTALGLCLGAVGLRFADVWLIGNLVASSMLLLTGVNLPIEELPRALSILGQSIPVTHAVEGARQVYATGDFGAGASAFAREGVIAAVYLVLAWVLLYGFEGSARKSAKTEVL